MTEERIPGRCYPASGPECTEFEHVLTGPPKMVTESRDALADAIHVARRKWIDEGRPPGSDAETATQSVAEYVIESGTVTTLAAALREMADDSTIQAAVSAAMDAGADPLRALLAVLEPVSPLTAIESVE